MSDKTQINPNIGIVPPEEPIPPIMITQNANVPNTEINTDMNLPNTIINTDIKISETEINPDIIGKADNSSEKGIPALKEGTVIGEKYEIVRPLNLATGEADIYVCSCDGKEYAAKIYRQKRAAKPAVTAILKSINSPYVAPLFEVGSYNGMHFEILPYYKNGSLQGKRFTLRELKENIIPCINEALKILHENDMIHKDLKPSNIMLSDDGKSVAIIDFGTSSVTEQGNTILVTKTGMTPEYSAPETFRNLFLKEADYYSLGITVYELFCGYTPYQNKSKEEIAQFTAVQRLPFPADMPGELKDLISAVTYFDITNRNNKKNPNRRWTYTEVDNWLKGKKQAIPGEGSGLFTQKTIPEYPFMGRSYKDIPTLITALATNWNEGKKQLYRGLLSAFFKNFNPELAGYCMDAEAEANRRAGEDDIIFWKLLYKLYPELNGFYWMGGIYESLPALGRDILERLWKNDRSKYSYWDGILGKKLLSEHLAAVNSKNSGLISAVSALEAAHALESRSKRDRIMNYYILAYLLSGQVLLAVGEKRLKNVSELASHMKGLLDSSYEEFQDFCHSLISYDDVLDVQLEAWLIALGKRNELESWRRTLNN